MVNISRFKYLLLLAATILRRHLGVRRDKMEKLYPFKKWLSIFCKIRQDFSNNGHKKMSKNEKKNILNISLRGLQTGFRRGL